MNWFELCKLSFDDLAVASSCKCPICEKDMIFPEKPMFTTYFQRNEVFCDNGCFYVEFRRKHVIDLVKSGPIITFEIYMFGELEHYHVKSHRLKLLEETQSVRDRIAYWKEDYRYLAEILERS